MQRGSANISKRPHTNKAGVNENERATGIETTFRISRPCAILTETCGNQRVRGRNSNRPTCTIHANKRTSSVRFCPKRFTTLSDQREDGGFFACCALADSICRGEKCVQFSSGL